MTDKKSLSFDPVTAASFCDDAKAGSFQMGGADAAKSLCALLTASFVRGRLPENAGPALDELFDAVETWTNKHLAKQDFPEPVHLLGGLFMASAILESRAVSIYAKEDPGAALGIATTMAVTRTAWALAEYEESNPATHAALHESMEPWLWQPEALIPVLQNIDSQGCPCGKCGAKPHPDAPAREVFNPVDGIIEGMIEKLPPELRDKARDMLREEGVDLNTKMGVVSMPKNEEDTPEAIAIGFIEAIQQSSGTVLAQNQRDAVLANIKENWATIQSGGAALEMRIPKAQ